MSSLLPFGFQVPSSLQPPTGNVLQPQVGTPTSANALPSVQLQAQLGQPLKAHLVAYNPACDPTSGEYDPFLCDILTGEQTQTVDSGGAGTTNVNVQTTLNLVNNIGDQLANVIADAIGQPLQEANQIATNTANQVADVLGRATNGIIQGVNSAFGSIGNWFQEIISYLGQHIQDIFGAIVNNIGDVLKSVGTAIAQSIGPILNTVNTALQSIQKINDTIIQPITTTILATIQTIGTLTTVIEQDLHNGLQGILQIPTDIANGLGSLDATLNRTMQQLGINLQGTASVTLGGTANDTLWTRLHALGSSLAGPQNGSAVQATYKDKATLSEPDILQVSQQFINTIEQIFNQLMHDAGGFADRTIANALQGVNDPTGIVNAMLAAGLHIAFTVLAAAGETYPLAEFLSGWTRQKLPLVKLDAGDAVTAWVRGFINDTELAQELGFAGLDATRVRALKDLAVKLLDPSTLIDMWFRTIINDADLSAALAQHGITADDQEDLKLASYRLVDVQAATIALRRGLITEEQWNDVLKTNKFTDSEMVLANSLLYAPETSDQTIIRERLTALYSGLGWSPDAFSDVPTDLQQAVAREGGDSRQALDKWQASYWVPQITQFVELYFRGDRTLTELYAVMDYYAVPINFRQDIIAAHRSLIPWRTIPTMLANGIISEPYAKQQLQAHGFDLTATEALLKYATTVHAKSKAQISGDPLQASVSAAHELWTIGAFTDQQYEETLVAHGFTQQQAAAIVNSQHLATTVKERKQLGQDIVNEVLAGLLTTDDANAQMALASFTEAEKAKVLRQIHKTQRATSKTPSLSELLKFVKAKIITYPEWRAAMATAGYSPKWIDAYAILDLPESLTGLAGPPATATFS